jgi:hydroxylamine reductase (hybrid-cluster protein)
VALTMAFPYDSHHVRTSHLTSLCCMLLDCTFQHFNSNSTCPCCRKNLGENDFMELVVADPSSASHETTKNSFQMLFTKNSASAKQLSQQEMCQRLLRNMDDNRRAARFLMKQFVVDSSTQASQSGNMGRAYEKLQEDFTQLKQATNSARLQADQTVADLQNRVQGMWRLMFCNGSWHRI